MRKEIQKEIRQSMAKEKRLLLEQRHQPAKISDDKKKRLLMGAGSMSAVNVEGQQLGLKSMGTTRLSGGVDNSP